MTMTNKQYDYIIVGSGIAGAILANELGKQGKEVLIIEAGPGISQGRNEYLKTYFEANMKTPCSPYPPLITENNNPDIPSNPSRQNTPRPTIPGVINWSDPSKSYLTYDTKTSRAFASGYERIGGGTTWHWLGTSLRFLENDFTMQSTYGVEVNWPITYNDLVSYYARAEEGIGVAGNTESQEAYGVKFPKGYEYPMPAVKLSMVDNMFSSGLAGMPPVDKAPVFVSSTPQGRLTQIRQSEKRPQCAGNTSCIPICPIQAKYDATITLKEALQYETVEIIYQTVVTSVEIDQTTQEISAVNYIQYEEKNGPATGSGSFSATNYILAAHAIEIPKILLNSPNPGIMINSKLDDANVEKCAANSSGLVGANLMDHTMYLAWGLSDKQVFPFRGPLSTAGIESMRDGDFRKERAAYRIEIGNEGWNWATGDPQNTLGDLIFGTNYTQMNPKKEKFFGTAMVDKLNDIYTRQIRLGFLIEQSPCPDNRVTLSKTETDNLGIPRPRIQYTLSDYTKNGFLSAKKTASAIFKQIGATEYTVAPPSTTNPAQNGTYFQYKNEDFVFYGAGHVVGTTTMGNNPTTSVLNSDLQSWDHANLYIIGSSVFPTITTANPTLTIAALTYRLADHLLKKAKA